MRSIEHLVPSVSGFVCSSPMGQDITGRVTATTDIGDDWYAGKAGSKAAERHDLHGERDQEDRNEYVSCSAHRMIPSDA